MGRAAVAQPEQRDLLAVAEHAGPVKPWQYQSWISLRAPDFAAKATVILDLYRGFYQGQATASCPRTPNPLSRPAAAAAPLPRPGAARPVLIEHKYVRHGALALLAALDVHTGTVFAATPATTGIVPFMDLMSQVMSLPEYKDAPRVLVIGGVR